MSTTDNGSIPRREDMEYVTVRMDRSRKWPDYYSVTINVEDMKRRQTIRRINRILTEDSE